MIRSFSLHTDKQSYHDITDTVKECVAQSGVKEGICVVYSPHTTAGITINEAADSDVTVDILFALNSVFPNFEQFQHFEGDSVAHVKAILTGASQSIIITQGKMLLGTWQCIYFAEYDGPRNRTFFVKVMEDDKEFESESDLIEVV